MTYCFDTSAFIEPWNTHYSIDVFSPLWDHLDRCLNQRAVISCDEVLRELGRRDDELHAWAKERADAFLALTEPIQAAAVEILASHPRLVGRSATRNGADPFVIATALVEDATVVTYEAPGGNKVKIPDVCAAYSVECITMLEFIRREHVSFTA